MCGRYTLFTEKEQRELYKIILEVDKKLDRKGQPPIKVGEIYPTNTAPIIVAEGENTAYEAAIWGFPNFNKKGVIINARAETAPEKPMFAKHFEMSRCVVPSTGFFEWDKEKTKYLFQGMDGDMVYMAGIASMHNQERRYVILTTNANVSMQEVHNRMPVILSKDEINKWLVDYQFALQVLHRVPVKLLKEDTGGQLKFE